MLRSEDVSKNMLLRSDDAILRVIDVRNDNVFLIDCIKRTMPEWADLSTVLCLEPCTEEDLWTETDVVIPEMQALTPEQLRLVHERFTMIACVLPFVSDKKERTRKQTDGPLLSVPVPGISERGGTGPEDAV